MLFQQYQFFIFLAVFTPVFCLLKGNARLSWVTLGSLSFYAWWYPPYTVVILGFIGMAWLGSAVVRRRPHLLGLTVLIVLLPLIGFKYTHFLLSIVDELTGARWSLPSWGLPLGVSFVTFTVLSLIIDSARRPAFAPPSLLSISVYITFFPHLLAGPILRAQQMLPQLAGMRIDGARLLPYLALFTVGVVKKVIVADSLSPYVEQAYSHAATIGSQQALVGILAFTFQIYCDFSAYSDMALALAGLFGITFPENFRSPYLAPSMNELWHRWHITLTRWFGDYVFTPLNRRLHLLLAIFLTMLISGVWHGAAWHFAAWGAYHGLIVTMEHASGLKRRLRHSRGLLRVVAIMVTFTLFTLGTPLFRAPSLEVAWAMLTALAGSNGWGAWPDAAPRVLALCAIVFALHGFDQRDRVLAGAAKVPAWLLVPLALMTIAACSLVVAGRPEAFYYFDF